MWTSAVGLRWSVVVLRERTHSRPRTYRKCHTVRAAMCKGLDYRCTDWLPSNFRLCCDCEACWPSFRNNHRLSQPRADSRCCSACTHRRYHRRSLRRYHHRRLRLHHRLLSSRNYRLEIETVCPFRRATVFLYRHRELSCVRVKRCCRTGGWRRRWMTRSRTPRCARNSSVSASGHAV